jgi:hypothetical protein
MRTKFVAKSGRSRSWGEGRGGGGATVSVSAVDACASGQVTAAGFCEHGSESRM